MSNNALNTLFTELGRAVLPLEHADSARQINRLFHELGYVLPGDEQFPGIPGLVSRIQAVIQGLVAFGQGTTDEERFEAAVELGQTIASLVEKVQQVEADIAAATAAIPNFAADAPLDQLPKRLLDYLLVEYTAHHRPGVNAVSRLVSLFEYQQLPEDLAHFQPATTLRIIHWDRLPRYFLEPVVLFDEIYKWETDFDSDAFLANLEGMLRALVLPGGLYPQRPTVQSVLENTTLGLQELRLPVLQHSEFPESFSQFGIAVTPAEAHDGLKKGFGVFPYVQGTADFDFDVSESLEITLDATASVDSALGIVFRHDSNVQVLSGLDTAPDDVGTFNAALQIKQRDNAGETILVGSPAGTRFSVEGISAKVFVIKSDQPDVGIELELEAIRLVISGGDGDGFIAKLLGDGGVNVRAALALGISQAEGFFIRGSGGLEIRLPTHISIGPIDLQEAIIGLKFRDADIVLDAGTTLKVELGPFTAVVENLGLSSVLSFEDGGNLGPANIDFGFKPPNGIGLSLDTPAVRGGGYLFFDPDNERYAGALELAIADMVNVTAIGLVTTRLPDGSKGFSLLLLVNAEFTPGITLGMGFFLSGLGGLIGIHRTLNENALRDGVRNGSLDHILFPKDVVANITRIISDIRVIFPPQRDQFMLGLMAKITWGVPALVSIEFGLIIEFKSPTRLAILGVLQVALPTEDEALIVIKVSFAGVINFDKQYLTFDASLFGSRILTFTLEGDMALRLYWGNQPAFLMSVGGFHPSFEPPARLNIGNMKRLTLNILSGNPRLTLTTYFAVTSNTVQFGAQIDFYFKVSKFKAIGYFGFDVLFQFSPFRFIAAIGAGVAVKLGDTTLLSISLSFELAGPTPWSAKGTGSFRILFIKIKVRFSKTWGDRKNISPPQVAVLPQLLEALEQDRNWIAEIPSRRFPLVSLREIDPEQAGVVVESFGSLKVSQNKLPLDLGIEKYGNSVPSDIGRARIGEVRVRGTTAGVDNVREFFAPSAFVDMADQDKLKSPSYVEERSGIRLRETDAIRVNHSISRKVEYEVRSSDFDRDGDQPYALFVPLALANVNESSDRFRRASKFGAVGRSPLSRELRRKSRAPKVQLGEERFAIANVVDLHPYTDVHFEVGTKAEANDQLRQVIADHPGLEGKLQIVAEYQLAS